MSWWLWVLLFLGAGAAFEVYTRGERRRNPHLAIKPLQPKPQQGSQPDEAWPEPIGSWVMAARRARSLGDIDAARMAYQKAAYGFKQLRPDQNQALKAEIAGFVKEDPRYLAGLALVLEQVRRSPGVMQSALGKAAGSNREALNYVLYFADLAGDIVRIKKGSSYQLFAPESNLRAAHEKAH